MLSHAQLKTNFLLPDHIFGGSSSDSVSLRRPAHPSVGVAEGVVEEEGEENLHKLESPSKVLGGSTSWTGGLSHGCAAVFAKNETGSGN